MGKCFRLFNGYKPSNQQPVWAHLLKQHRNYISQRQQLVIEFEAWKARYPFRFFIEYAVL